MKRFVFTVFTCLLLNFVVGQDVKGKEESFNFFDISTIDIFSLYSDLDSIHLQFEQKEADFIILFFRKASDSPVSEFFDLQFEGDKYLLQRKYNLIFSYLFNFKECDKVQRCEKIDEFKISYYPNTFRFTKRYSPGLLYASAKKSKMEELFDTIKAEFDVLKILENDSVLIFQAIVNREGGLGDMELIFGRRSSFSHFLIGQFLGSGSGVFTPLRDGGGSPRRGLIDLSVRLHEDGKTTISASGRKRKLKIKDTANTSPILL